VRYVHQAELFYSAVHGTAMRYAAERRDLAESIAEIRELADGHDEVLAEAAGITAGSWYAWPSTHVGYEIATAGMMIMAGGHDGKPFDFDDLERWTRVGYERVCGSARVSGDRRVRLIRLLDKGRTDRRALYGVYQASG
jgi:hypothetical protein